MGIRRRFGRLIRDWVDRKPFSTSSAIVEQTGKPLNLYSAINQALHIALETDPRSSFSFSFCIFTPDENHPHHFSSFPF